MRYLDTGVLAGLLCATRVAVPGPAANAEGLGVEVAVTFKHAPWPLLAMPQPLAGKMVSRIGWDLNLAALLL